jgi:hypothetical protein
LDFVFIVLYCVTLVLLVAVNTHSAALTNTAMIAVAGTGIFDCWEDFRLLKLLKAMNYEVRANVPLARPVSLLKWALFATDLVLVSVALLQAHSRGGTLALLVIAILILLAAGSTVLGLIKTELIGASILFLLPALVWCAFIWTP